MTPNLELMLATIERALTTSILPTATNAAAKEEASLAILFTRWIREVLDHLPAAERSSYRDCRAALVDAVARVEARPASPHALDLVRESRIPPLDADGASPAELRQAARGIKALLGRLLRALRAEGDAALANEVRARLYDLGAARDRARASFRESLDDGPGLAVDSFPRRLARGEATSQGGKRDEQLTRCGSCRCTTMTSGRSIAES